MPLTSDQSSDRELWLNESSDYAGAELAMDDLGKIRSRSFLRRRKRSSEVMKTCSLLDNAAFETAQNTVRSLAGPT